MPFQVSGTKKGGMPVTVEKRPKGKVATVISNVKGDKDELLAMVKAAVGAGGSVAGHDRVEIQGDHAAKIQSLLLRHQDRTGCGPTMKGVAGLKPKPEKPKPEEEESRARREEKVRSAEVLAQQKQRRVETRQRAVREAMDTKVESTRHFHVFVNMMKAWPFWSQDWSMLREMHERHNRDLDEAARAGRGRGITSILDAESDETHPARRSEVLEAMNEGLAALSSSSGMAPPTKSPARSSKLHDQRAALMALGMIAAPSPFRQSRQERLAEAKRRQAAAREAARNAPAAPAQSKAIERPFDPALAALRAFGDLPDRRSSSFAAVPSRPAAAASFAAATRPAATRPAPVSRVPRGGRGRGGASGMRPRGGHGKGDPKRPSLGYTGARKGTGSGVYGGDLGGDRDDAFDDESEEEEEDYSYDVGGDSRGWEAAPGGGFSFGPIAGAEDHPPGWQHRPPSMHSYEIEEEAMDAEEADLREALRLSLLEEESRKSRFEPSDDSRVGLHVECGDLWGDLTEEEAFELAKQLSEEQGHVDRESRDWYEPCGPVYDGSDPGLTDPRDRLAKLCGVDADDEAAIGLADLVLSMDSIEDAAELVAATAGCDRGEAEEVAAALRRDGGEEVGTEEPEPVGNVTEPAGNVAAGFMPESMDEDAALAEALRLSALDAEVVDVPVPPTHTPAPAPGGELLGWADAQLSMFTGEEDNAFLAEYVCEMEDAKEIEEFLRESFPSENSDAAASFARALVLMRS